MNRSDFYNGGAYSRTELQAINKAATAGGAGDATAIDGDYIDRKGNNGIALSAKLVVAFTAALAGGETLSIAAKFQDATDGAGSGVADIGDALASTVVATGASGGSTETGTVEMDIDLGSAREFIRSVVTPDLSAGGTDTCNITAVLVLYGDGRQPASKALASVRA